MPLNPVARAAIEELRRVFHVADLTPDEIVELNDLGAAQMAAGRDGDSLAVSYPVVAGNVVLHPMTCAAADFVDRFSGGVLDENERSWLILYALAFGRDVQRLERISASGARALRGEIRRWSRTVAATPEELEDATARLNGDDPVQSSAGIRAMSLALADAIEPYDRESAKAVRDLCECVASAIRRFTPSAQRRDGEDGDRSTDRDAAGANGAPCEMFWKRMSAELGAITGVSPDYWYAEDKSLALIAYGKAVDFAAATARGAGDGGRQPRAVVESLKALRDAMKRIVDARRARDSMSGGSPAGGRP